MQYRVIVNPLTDPSIGTSAILCVRSLVAPVDLDPAFAVGALGEDHEGRILLPILRRREERAAVRELIIPVTTKDWLLILPYVLLVPTILGRERVQRVARLRRD